MFWKLACFRNLHVLETCIYWKLACFGNLRVWKLACFGNLHVLETCMFWKLAWFGNMHVWDGGGYLILIAVDVLNKTITKDSSKNYT